MIVAEFIKKFHIFYGIRMFISVFISVLYRFLICARWMYSTNNNLPYLRAIVLLPFHLFLSLSSGLFLSAFKTKMFVGSEDLIEVVMMSSIFCNITPCSPWMVHRDFAEKLYLHLQAWIIFVWCVLHACFLFRLLFDGQEGGDMFCSKNAYLELQMSGALSVQEEKRRV